MKLYFTPGLGSLAAHIIAREAGFDPTLVKVDLAAKRLSDGSDYHEINPKGFVPALELDNGEVLTELPAVMQYLADQKPEAGLGPAAGTFERYRMQELLGFINSELHKPHIPLFHPKATPEDRAALRGHIRRSYAFLEKQLAGKPYLSGDRFGIADAYVFTTSAWAAPGEIDLSDCPSLVALCQRVAERPAVRAALAAEGLGG